jgi:hypothetical protein
MVPVQPNTYCSYAAHGGQNWLVQSGEAEDEKSGPGREFPGNWREPHRRLVAAGISLEYGDTESTHGAGINHAKHSGPHCEIVVGGNARRLLEPGKPFSDAKRGEQVGLGGGSKQSKALALGVMSDFAEIDMGGEILTANASIELIRDAVLVVCPERALPAMPGEQLLGRVAVVDDQCITAGKRLGELIDPACNPGREFNPVADAQAEVMPLDIIDDRWIDSLAKNFGEPAVSPVDERFVQAAVDIRYPTHRERVKKLIRDRASCCGVSGLRDIDPFGVVAGCEVIEQVRHPMAVLLDRPVADPVVEVGMPASDFGEERANEPSGSGAVFDDRKWGRIPE